MPDATAGISVEEAMGFLDESKQLLDMYRDESGCDDSASSVKSLLQKRLAFMSRYTEEGLLPEKFHAPLTLQYEITYKCNLRCMMCYNASGAADGRTDMTDEEWMAVADESCRMGVLEAIVSGGEPFLRPDLVFRLLDFFRKNWIVPHLITNGWFITPEIARRLAEYPFGFIQVSIDGHTPEIHDRVRQVKGSWDRATRALQYLSSQGLPCRLAHTAVKFNYQHVPEIVDLAIALGARTVIFGKALAQGRGNTNADDVLLGPEEAKAFTEIYRQQRKEKFQYVNVVLGMQTAHQLLESHMSPNAAVVVRPNGEVRIGCLAPFVYGNVREQSLRDIWQAGANQGFRHPEVLKYTKDVLANGELAAVRRLNLNPHQESKSIHFDAEELVTAQERSILSPTEAA
jgi:PqqA peptide cyclase